MSESPPFEHLRLSSIKKNGILATIRTQLRRTILGTRRLYLVHVWGMDIHPFTLISLKANLDKTFPRGVHVGEGTNISFDAAILTHDLLRLKHEHTYIGKYCGIGARSIILPGLTVGDHSIVAAGSVVTKDVPPHSIVAGNPARVIRTGIMTARWGKLLDQGTSVKDENAA